MAAPINIRMKQSQSDEYEFESDMLNDLNPNFGKYKIVQKGHLYGLRGSVNIPIEYLNIHPDEQGHLIFVDRNYFSGFLCKKKYWQNKPKVDCKYDKILGYGEGLFVVSKNGKVGFVSIVEEDFETGYIFQDAIPFSEGFAAVNDNGKWFYIDKSFKPINELLFDVVHKYTNGYAKVIFNGKNLLMNMLGEIVAEEGDDDYEFLQQDFVVYEHHVVDKRGKLIISKDAGFTFFGPYSEGLIAAVKKNDTSPWADYSELEGTLCFIDIKCNTIISPQFNGISSYSNRYKEKDVKFSEGFACVCFGFDRYGYIDKKGKIVIPRYFDLDHLNTSSHLNFGKVKYCNKHFKNGIVYLHSALKSVRFSNDESCGRIEIKDIYNLMNGFDISYKISKYNRFKEIESWRERNIAPEWTDEDSWDAMTDGHYGDYGGPGWDTEKFGY